jgi:hypothetical protein
LGSDGALLDGVGALLLGGTATSGSGVVDEGLGGALARSSLRAARLSTRSASAADTCVGVDPDAASRSHATTDVAATMATTAPTRRNRTLRDGSVLRRFACLPVRTSPDLTCFVDPASPHANPGHVHRVNGAERDLRCT